MAKLNQIVAVVSGKKTKAHELLTDTHRWHKDLLAGISKTYQPKDEDGERVPDEQKPVQVLVSDSIKKICSELQDFYDTVATQERTNCDAKADIRVGKTLISSAVPISVLMFIEKQLIDLRTFISGIPVLPTDREWTYSVNRNCYVTSPVQQNRTKKVKKVLVKYEATKEHPAQTETYDTDEVAGTWTTVHFSGAIPQADRAAMLERTEQLLEAVKLAREEANSIDAKETKIGKEILQFVFGDILRTN